MNEFCEVENTDPAQHQRWMEKHGFKEDENGYFAVNEFEGKLPVTSDALFDNIRTNTKANWYEEFYAEPYDERTFVMVCGGPSLEKHLDEIRTKTYQGDKYVVACSNMTYDYLVKNNIHPHVHFVIDPQEKKHFDVSHAQPITEYWINIACHPSVFETLKKQGIKPYAFLADFESEGKARQALVESLQPGRSGMAAIQGGTMAGLRAINLADAKGFRKMEYYGFDACVEVKDGKAKPYAYEKKRGEAIIEIQCDKCNAKFDTTLIFQRQVNEFIDWSLKMPWIDIRIIGGGLIAHYQEHVKELQKKEYKVPYRFSLGYAELQQKLHSKGLYGTTGQMYSPVIFHAVSQLVKKHGTVTMLDYGSSSGATFKALQDSFWVPPGVSYKQYDPFVEEFSEEPEPADLLICTDVLEHVEPECTDAVLDHIQKLTKKLAFFSISLKPAQKVLEDGRNAHINLRSAEYWFKNIQKRFVMSEAKVDHNGEECLVVAQSIEGVKEVMRQRKQMKAAA